MFSYTSPNKRISHSNNDQMISYTISNKRISNSNNDQKLLTLPCSNEQTIFRPLLKKENCHRPILPPWNYTPGPKSPAPPVKLGTNHLRLLKSIIRIHAWWFQAPQIYDSGSRLATSSFWPFCQDELRICSSGQSNFSGQVYLVVEVEIKHRRFPIFCLEEISYYFVLRGFPHILSWGDFPIFCLEDTRESFATKNLIQDFLVFHRSSQVRLWHNRWLN